MINKRKHKFALGGIDPLSLGMSAVQGVASIYNAAKVKADQQTANRLAKQLNDNNRRDMDSNFLDDFNTSGSNVAYYKDGGSFRFNARTSGNKSKFKPIGNGAFEVKGASHANGGVKVGGAEVEGGEVVKFTPQGMKILSDNNNYFGYSPADNVKDNPTAFNYEFVKQEARKGGVKTKGKFGSGGFNPIWSGNIIKSYNDAQVPTITPNKYSILPSIIDNVTNAATTAMTPKIPAPHMEPHVRLNTDIDVNPQINAVKANERGSINYLNKNISDANVASAMAMGVGNQSTTAINSIRANEINQENQLKNQEISANIPISARNVQQLNEFSMNNVQRRLGINSSINANMNNLSRDIIDLQDKKRFDKRDSERMNIMLAMDTEGAMSELIKGGQFDTNILNGSLNISTLRGATRRAAMARQTYLNTQRK